ncbi:translation initiation factor IF-3 [candidate division Kazan bacterium]|uniref:Translation initiation factor IF-3 n=1 Tax=candidate division Kazan bacterium TaxID=2202143 RepID=A0A420ZDE9_UNCK3|nr:MAG: translation initiation factor IF-3 [candidate division Kazan bacterium]
MKRHRRKPYTPQVRINERIRVPEVHLIDGQGKSRGSVPTATALVMAREAGLDLVEVSSNANPPIAKIIDAGKYKYDQAKAKSRTKKHQKEASIKEIRLGFKIDDHDFDVKFNRAKKFLSQGDKVKAAVIFRGREITHIDLGKKLLDKFVDRLSEVARIEQAPIRQGRSIHTVLSPK